MLCHLCHVPHVCNDRVWETRPRKPQRLGPRAHSGVPSQRLIDDTMAMGHYAFVRLLWNDHM
jgi:hypothetical protein